MVKQMVKQTCVLVGLTLFRGMISPFWLLSATAKRHRRHLPDRSL